MENLSEIISEVQMTFLAYNLHTLEMVERAFGNLNSKKLENLHQNFTPINFCREIKLESLIENSKLPNYIIFDITGINLNRGLPLKESLGKTLKSLNFELENMNIKLIVTGYINNSLVESEGKKLYRSTPLYPLIVFQLADLVIGSQANKLKIMKNVN